MTERDADDIIADVVAAGEVMATHIVAEIVKRADLNLADVDREVCEKIGNDIQLEQSRDNGGQGKK